MKKTRGGEKVVKVLNLFPVQRQEGILRTEKKSGKGFEQVFQQLMTRQSPEAENQSITTQQSLDSLTRLIGDLLLFFQELYYITSDSEFSHESLEEIKSGELDENLISTIKDLIEIINQEWTKHVKLEGELKNSGFNQPFIPFEEVENLRNLHTKLLQLKEKNMVSVNEGQIKQIQETATIINQISSILKGELKYKGTERNQDYKHLVDLVEKLGEKEKISHLINGLFTNESKGTKSRLNSQNFYLNQFPLQHDIGKIKTTGNIVDSAAVSGLIQSFQSSGNNNEFSLTLTMFKEGAEQSRPVQQEFVQKFLDVLKSSKLYRAIDGKSTMTIRLHPEHLGTLTVKLLQQNNETVAKIIAATQSAKELLEHSIHQLRQVLPNTEIEISRFELLEEQTMPSFREHQEKKQNQHENQHEQKQDGHSESFKEKLDEQLNFQI